MHANVFQVAHIVHSSPKRLKKRENSPREVNFWKKISRYKNEIRFLETGPARVRESDDREEGEKEERQEAEGVCRLMREQPAGISDRFAKKRLTNSA